MTPGPYHLVSLVAVLLLSYFISLLMVRTRLLTLQIHRKFWNILLAVFFLSTAILGLLLAVRVNYKLNIKWLDEAMQWHVDSGIGFALVAIFHLLWHFKYYVRRQTTPLENTTPASLSPYLSFSPFQERSYFLLLGYISIMAQLVLLREFVKSFHGNELVIGIFLASWMILTALGARLGAGYRVRIPQQRLCLLLFLLGLLPTGIYLLLILTGRFLFLPGLQAGLMDTTIVLVVLTAIFTGLSGFLFGFVSGAIEQKGSSDQKGSDASSYRLDAIGAVVGGVLFGLILVHLMDNIQLLTFLFLTTTLAVALIYKFPVRASWRLTLILIAALLFISSMIPQFKNKLEELRYKGEEILETRDTPYGNLTFTSRDEQLSGYMDGNPVFSSSDLTGTEESVHFPTLQHPNPRSFLLLGGGSGACIAEVAKYNPERIDYCEANPWVYRLGQAHLPDYNSEALQFIPKDGRSWLNKEEDVRYDVIISTAARPLTLGWNRYFTLEFYRMVEEHLGTGGIFCMRLLTSNNYVNEEGIRILAINMTTLKEAFSHVLIVPGSSTYFLASDHPLSLDFPALLNDRKITTSYVHPDYLDTNHLHFDSEQLTNDILQEEALANTDLRPRLFFSALSGLEAISGKHSMKITGVISVLLFLVLFFRYGPVKRAMYITGFTGASIQIVLIMVMQSFYGYAYMVAPMMITLFMAGIVVGTLTWQRVWHTSSIVKLAGLVLIMALIALAGAVLPGRVGLFNSQWIGQLILAMLNFLPGVVVGSVYAMGVGNTDGNHPGIRGVLYSADLTGAALGTFMPALFLLPLIGVSNTFILFSGINLVCGLSMLVRRLIRKGDG